MSGKDGLLSETIRKELSCNLVVLRRASGRTQVEQAEIFNVSERNYKRWEVNGPVNFTWDQWDILYKEAAKQAGKKRRKEVTSIILKILNSTKHIKDFIESFGEAGRR